MYEVVILGGYGNFGKRIARLLTWQRIGVVIAGRSLEKAEKMVKTLPDGLAEAAVIDIHSGLKEWLKTTKARVVINTCGPFQESDYGVAEACIAAGVAYIDLADGRDFVTGIKTLDEAARAKKVPVISGASTVPGLSSAVVEHFMPEFSEIEMMRYGIAPGQKAERGLATTQAILGYVGRRLKPCAGFPVRYGWQDLYRQDYPEIGQRWMANCDVPDLDLLPEIYGIKAIRFSAGMENPLVHFGIWVMGWVVRLGLPLNPARYAALLLRVSNWFDAFGSSDGGMHVVLEGKDKVGNPLTRTWFIVARDGDGPYIPTIPAVVLTKRILAGAFDGAGAMACVGLVSLEEYLAELAHLKVRTYVES